MGHVNVPTANAQLPCAGGLLPQAEGIAHNVAVIVTGGSLNRRCRHVGKLELMQIDGENLFARAKCDRSGSADYIGGVETAAFVCNCAPIASIASGNAR